MEAISSLVATFDNPKWPKPPIFLLALLASLLLHAGVAYVLGGIEVGGKKSEQVKVEEKKPLQVIYLGTQVIHAKPKTEKKGNN